MRGAAIHLSNRSLVEQCLAQTVVSSSRPGLQASSRIWTRPASYSSHQWRKSREMSKRIDSKIAYLCQNIHTLSLADSLKNSSKILLPISPQKLAHRLRQHPKPPVKKPSKKPPSSSAPVSPAPQIDNAKSTPLVP